MSMLPLPTGASVIGKVRVSQTAPAATDPALDMSGNLRVVVSAGTVMMAGGVDQHGFARAIRTDETGQVLCAPGRDAISYVYSETCGVWKDALHACNVEQRELSSWRYDVPSSLLGAGASLVLVAAMVVGIMRRGAK